MIDLTEVTMTQAEYAKRKGGAKMDGPTQVRFAQSGSDKLRKEEKAMMDAVRTIITTAVKHSEQGEYDPKALFSVVVRTENLIKALEAMYMSAPYLVNPDSLEHLREEIAEYRTNLEAIL